MELYCTRPSCPRPRNVYPDLDDKNTLTTVTQKFCTTCGMPLILVGRYLPTRLLGKGGFGTAFLAIDRYTPAQRQCVVKQFLPAGKFTPTQLQTAQDLFAREAAVLEELGHQHNQIPDLFAFFPLNVNNSGGKPEDFFYLVQEFIDGEDLEKELERQKFFTEEQALEILESMLPVLEFVHQRGVIHRDIKPSNIMRDRRGRLYLLDFGAVKQATAGNAPQQKSTGIYSLGFAPPEQMAGDQVFPATDIYALAVTVISLLTGKEPQDLLDSYTGQWQWRNYVQVSDRLGTVLDKMLRPIPSERYASATEVIKALASNNPVNPIPSPIPSPTNNPNPSLNTKPNTKPNTNPSSIAPPLNNPSTAFQPPPVPLPATPPPAQLSPITPRFSLMEALSNTAFVGFQSPLILIILNGLLPNPALSLGLGGMIIGGFVYLLYKKTIEHWDLLIIIGITLGVVLIFPALMGTLPLTTTLLLALMGGAASVAITTIFLLVYKLISRVV